MIESFKHKELLELFYTGKNSKIDSRYKDRILRILDAVSIAVEIEELDIPSFHLHALHGKPRRYSIWVNEVWRITFEWKDDHALRVDFENYH